MTDYFTEHESAESVIARLQHCDDPRFAQIMTCAIHHLHAFVKEVRPSMREWQQAIDFLTRTGQKCDDKRQEWILASDTLGVSMLLETINHPASDGRTEATVLGPFHVADAPVLAMGSNICRDHKGLPCVVSGRILDLDANPIEGAMLDIWQTNDDGFYDVQQPDSQPAMNLRARFITGANGRYHFRTVKPVSYPVPTDGPVGAMLTRMGRHPYRPAHIHFIITHETHESLVTHIFAKGDPYLDSDAVFGVKRSLIADFVANDDPQRAAELGVSAPFCTAQFDFNLAPKAG